MAAARTAPPTITSVVLSDISNAPLFRRPRLVIAPLNRLGAADRTRRGIGQRRARQVFFMRLFPRLMRQRRFRGRLVIGPVQPAMPIGTDPAGLCLAIEDDPTPVALARAVEDVSLLVLANLHALAPRIELSVERLPVPPGDRTQKGVENAHGNLR